MQNTKKREELLPEEGRQIYEAPRIVESGRFEDLVLSCGMRNSAGGPACIASPKSSR